MTKRMVSIVVSLLSLCFLFFGCQPTPDIEDTQYIIKEESEDGGNPVEGAAQQSEGRVFEGAETAAIEPQKLFAQGETAKGGLLTIDAVVTEPQRSNFKIATLEATTFTDQQVKDVVAYFAQDRPLYDAVTDGYMPKKELNLMY